jgi:hypothetical protein
MALLPHIAALLLAFAVGGMARAEDYKGFLAGSRSGRPERRREVLEALLADPDLVPEGSWDRTHRILAKILRSDADPELRAMAARCMALHRAPKADAALIDRLERETDWRAQRGIMGALGGLEEDGLVALLEKRAFRDPRDDVRALWVEALGRCAHPRAFRTLLTVAGTPAPWPVAQAAAIALRRHRNREAVGRLIDLLWSEDPGVRSAAHESLVKLTGKRDLGREAGPWVEWWGKEGEDFRFPEARPGDDEDPHTVAFDPVTVPTYYEIPIRGRKVIFCLDVSASMWGPKIDAAMEELSVAIRSLPTTRRFTVIFFNEHPFPWREDLVPAYPFQKLACVTTFEDMDTKMYTNLFDTLERALGFAGLGRRALDDPPGVDDVFLLTDGEPNRGKYRDVRGILKGLEEIDPLNRVRIHTISVGDEPRELMAAIAKARGGRHFHVHAEK